jgi:hypothetical protein
MYLGSFDSLVTIEAYLLPLFLLVLYCYLWIVRFTYQSCMIAVRNQRIHNAFPDTFLFTPLFMMLLYCFVGTILGWYIHPLSASAHEHVQYAVYRHPIIGF